MKIYFHLHNTTYCTPQGTIPDVLFGACDEIISVAPSPDGDKYAVVYAKDRKLPISYRHTIADINTDRVVNTDMTTLAGAVMGNNYLPSRLTGMSGQYFLEIDGEMYFFWGRAPDIYWEFAQANKVAVLEDEQTVRIIKDRMGVLCRMLRSEFVTGKHTLLSSKPTAN
jgi:hypothetical protein